MVGILHDTGSEVAIHIACPLTCCMPCWTGSLFCFGDNQANVLHTFQVSKSSMPQKSGLYCLWHWHVPPPVVSMLVQSEAMGVSLLNMVTAHCHADHAK